MIAFGFSLDSQDLPAISHHFKVSTMSHDLKWRIAHLAADAQSYNDFVAAFEQAYRANNEPKFMAMFSHVDSLGTLMAVSITPQSVPYCSFSSDWEETSKSPLDFGYVGWVAGDVQLKIT